MKYVVTINNKRYEVEVEKGEASVLSTTTVETVVAQATAPAVPVAPAATPPAPVSAGSVSGETIAAPMPGVILGIKVSEGSAVKKGDIIMILEAMKMENEIFAPCDGVITQIAVAKGASVNTGDVLAAMK